MTVLAAGGVPVAVCEPEPDVDVRLAPRPYLHPVRTLGGTVVTDAFCRDHPWHLGASVTLADVGGHNLWGGRTFVRDRGYTWLDDHGRVRQLAPGVLSWQDAEGRELLREHRTVTAAPAPGGWRLSFSYALTAPAGTTLGSPATHGRTGGAGYGGFFWRFPAGRATATGPSGADPHGSAEPWVAFTVDDAYTVVFEGLAGDDRWFVRTEGDGGGYNGVCAALAYDRPLVLAAGETLRRDLRVLIADGVPSAQLEAMRRAGPRH